MTGEFRTGREPGHRVNDTRRQNLIGDLDKSKHRKWWLLARFDDHSVSGSQRGSALLREVNGRPIERQDRSGHTIGLVVDPRLNRALIDDLAVQRTGDAGVVVEAGV